MRRCVALLAALVAALALAGPAGATSGPFGLHSMLQLNTPRAYKEAMFAAAANAGASEIRVDASLGALNNPWIETAMWQGLDDYVALSRQYGVPVLLDFNANNDPALESCPAGADPSSGICGVSDLAGYYQEIAAVVAHVRGVIDDFEIVNEPDGAWAFNGTPQQYAGMLATAYNAVHHTDPAGRVLLGGIMNPSSTGWLTAVFTTPGFDALHAFDIANIHLRDTLANLPAEVLAWRRFFTFVGDGNVPLWVTETGYPADPAYQYDAAFRGTDAASGEVAQASYVAKALPALLFAGVARVFVTEHDMAGGQYASEGLLEGGDTVSDQTGATPIARSAWAVFSQLCAEFANVATTPLALAPAQDTSGATASSAPAASTAATPAAVKLTAGTHTPAPVKSAPHRPAPRKPAPRKPALHRAPARHGAH